MEDPRKKMMLQLKKKNKTNREIGEVFKISDERVRQIIGNFGHIPSKKTKTKCAYCKKIFIHPLSEKRKYCTKQCYLNNRMLIPGKPRREYTKKERQAYDKKRNDKRKEYRDEYFQRPEVKKRLEEYRKGTVYKNYQNNYKKKKYEKENTKRKKRKNTIHKRGK